MLQLWNVDKTQIKKWVMPMGNKLAASTTYTLPYLDGPLDPMIMRLVGR